MASSKKYQVFISSTFKDLIDERQDVYRATLDLDQIPSGMELFPAADQEQFEYIKQVIDECDYYVLIIGARYGSVDKEGIGYTELEYSYAVENGKNVIALVHGDPSSIPVGKADTDPDLVGKLTAFRQRVQSGRLVNYWTSRDTLQAAYLKSLVHAMKRYPGVGWVRADSIASEDLLKQINNMRLEKEELLGRLKELQRQIAPVVADLAGLDDTYSVSYKYSKYQGQGRYSSGSSNIDMTWAEIFIAIAPNMIRPLHVNLLDDHLAKYMKERRSVQVDPKIVASDVHVIKIHLSTLNLIEIVVLDTTNGTSAEFLRLTQLGTKKMREMLSVRKVTTPDEEGQPND